MLVWAKAFGAFPAGGDETKSAALVTVGKNADFFHSCSVISIEFLTLIELLERWLGKVEITLKFCPNKIRLLLGIPALEQSRYLCPKSI